MISIEHLTKQYGGVTVLDDINLEIKRGETLVMLGSSGSGKTTLLKILMNLVRNYQGSITINEQKLKPKRSLSLTRKIGYVPQKANLFPHLSLLDNVCITPSMQARSPFKRALMAARVLKLVKMPLKTFRDVFPHEISGGQAQRINVARALAIEPLFLLMDEPFSALDQITKRELQDELLQIQKRLRITTIFVTHDIDEALKLADRIAVLHEGKLQQLATPKALIEAPENDFVKSLLEQHIAREASHG